jgi:hypothetical protein
VFKLQILRFLLMTPDTKKGRNPCASSLVLMISVCAITPHPAGHVTSRRVRGEMRLMRSAESYGAARGPTVAMLAASTLVTNNGL